MTGYRRALGRSRVPRRYVPWSEKAFYLEQSKKKIQIDGTKGSSSATRNSFCQEHPQSSKRRFWRWHALQQYPRSPMGPAAWNREREREMVNRVQLDIRAAVPEAQAPPPTTGEQLPRRVYIRRAVELARYGYTDQRTVRPKNVSELILPARKIEFETCK